MPEKRITSQEKHDVMERAKGCCEYCRSQVRFAMQPFSVEHIVPRSRGGKTELENLALACQGCNNHKFQPPFVSGPSQPLTSLLLHFVLSPPWPPPFSAQTIYNFPFRFRHLSPLSTFLNSLTIDIAKRIVAYSLSKKCAKRYWLFFSIRAER